MSAGDRHKSVYLETFGCQMNELDSELVMGALRALGYGFVHEPDAAGVVLYNTCSVRDLAEQKVRSRLGEMAVRKRKEPDLVVGVLGCMAERDGAKMLHKFPAVDIMCGPGELDKMPALLDNAVRTRQSLRADDDDAWARSARQLALQGDTSRRSGTLAAASDTLEMLDLSRSVSPIDHGGSAYVRITRGCNKFCTYCVVPSTRGAEMHRPPDHIVEECKRLADAGVIEVTLLGQTVNHYRFEHGAAVRVDGVMQPQKGRSHKGGHARDVYAGERVTTFADLLRRIHEEAPGIQRLRFVTSYPRDFGDDVLAVMRDSPRICRYLHCPAQSGSDVVLARMNRGYTVGDYLEFVERARAFLDEPEQGRPLSIAGDVIVGFCGETDADFEQTKDLLRRVKFKNNFIFKYSPRPGTTAFDRLPDDVPEQVKRDRCNELIALQQEISDEVGQGYVGQTVDVFVQGLSAVETKRAKRAQAAHQHGNGVALTIGGRSVGEADEGDCCDTGACGCATSVQDPGAANGHIQLTSRTDGDLIVVFDCPAGTAPDAMIGRIVPVRVTSAKGITLQGVLQP
ncbi:MAG: MiaB/RimO family radical SAM methylthiotransferase [Phycisphaerales bacterium]|nr:MiaB/RimO family radical SAM methylthiotransferase [Phycisphaerales bacterium]